MLLFVNKQGALIGEDHRSTWVHHRGHELVWQKDRKKVDHNYCNTTNLASPTGVEGGQHSDERWHFGQLAGEASIRYRIWIERSIRTTDRRPFGTDPKKGSAKNSRRAPPCRRDCWSFQRIKNISTASPQRDQEGAPARFFPTVGHQNPLVDPPSCCPYPRKSNE